MGISAKTFDEFGADFQRKIVQALLVDKSFAEQMIEMLDVNYFGLKYLRTVTSKYFKYYEKYNTFPSFPLLVTILRDELGNDGEEKLVKRQILEYLKNIKSSPLNGDIGYVKEKSLEFCKSQSMRKSLLKSIEMIEEGNYDGVVAEVKSSIELGGERNLGHDYHEQIDDRMKVETIEAIRTGFAVLDDVNILNGGLAKGELGVICAPTGAGKSLFCAILTANAMRNGKNVVYYTLELDEKTIGKRIDSNFSTIPQNELHLYEDVVKEAIGKYAKGKLKIKYYPTKTASVQTIRSHLNRLAIRGFIPDMVIVDYADVVRGSRYLNEKRLEVEAVYEDLRGMAGELEIPIWTCSQINRSGSDDEIIEISSVSESWAKMAVADVVLTLSRRLKDKMNNTGRLYVGKNRRGRDGIAVPLILDPSRVQCEIYEKMDTNIVEKMAKSGGGFDVGEMLQQNGVRSAFQAFQNRKNVNGDDEKSDEDEK